MLDTLSHIHIERFGQFYWSESLLSQRKIESRKELHERSNYKTNRGWRFKYALKSTFNPRALAWRDRATDRSAIREAKAIKKAQDAKELIMARKEVAQQQKELDFRQSLTDAQRLVYDAKMKELKVITEKKIVISTERRA